MKIIKTSAFVTGGVRKLAATPARDETAAGEDEYHSRIGLCRRRRPRRALLEARERQI